MITIKLTFFASLQKKFGEADTIVIKEPMEFRQILELFHSKDDQKGSTFFLENGALKKGFIVLINGRNILALKGVNTHINQNCELSFFPIIAGGLQNHSIFACSSFISISVIPRSNAS